MDFNVTPEQIASTKPVEPGWYPLEVTKVSFEVTKGSEAKPSDGSMNAIFFFKAIDGPPNVKGRELRKYVNEKSPQFAASLFATLFPGQFNKDKGGKLTSDMLKSSEGKKLSGYLKMNAQGFPNVEDFKPLEVK